MLFNIIDTSCYWSEWAIVTTQLRVAERGWGKNHVTKEAYGVSLNVNKVEYLSFTRRKWLVVLLSENARAGARNSVSLRRATTKRGRTVPSQDITKTGTNPTTWM